ncbi:MAG: AsnC family transcriptional regulator [Bacillota bacterium]
MKSLDSIDEELLNLTQQGIPLSATPYADLGAKLGIATEDVISRLEELKKEGYIRRLGGIFSSRKLGYVSTLIACRVAESKFYEVAEAINQYRGVTHNYRRNHNFNLWFTLIAPNDEELEKQLAEIEELTGIEQLRRLPAKRFFKLGVNLDMKSDEGESK